MPPKKIGPAHLLLGLRTLGLGLSLHAAVYPLRRTYHDARFAPGKSRGSVLHGLHGLLASRRVRQTEGIDPRGFTFLGDIIGHSREGQTITIRCQHASLEVTVLAPDLLRVRLSRSGVFPALHSYSIARPDEQWPQTSCRLEENALWLDICTSQMTCRMSRRPCRLSFLSADGQLVHTDTHGIGWQGKRVARFAGLEPDEHVYGLGERALPLDRRGRSYVMWNTDPQSYPPGTDPLYLNIPFYIGFHNGRGYGLFYDNTYRSRFDLGETYSGEAAYVAEDGELCFYFLCGPGLDAIVSRYTELTGRMPLPPLWALGYQQSRWSYYPESRVREVARLFREHQIPCDVLHLDIHYMDGYRCFTWDESRFPDPAGMLTDLHEQGFKIVTLVDCGIKVDHHYAVCAEGLAEGMFCKYPDGTPASGPVWPGECYFPDFTSPTVRQWWGGLHASLVNIGVDGVWNDMNEPTVIGPSGDTLAECIRHDCEGTSTDHRQAHNVYGMQMARATREGLLRLRPHRRPFVFTRSGWAGVQRYATSWTADNQSTWEHVRLTMPMLLGLGLSGLAWSGPDIGGFEGGADPELLVRWTQMGAFLPFFRNHTALHNPGQEPWAHGEPYTSLNRKAIELRYRLLPYLYTAAWQCAERGLPVVRPLLMAYPDDPQTYAMDDEFLCGDALLVAPVCTAKATTRDVYLPAGKWFDFWTEDLREGPATLSVSAPLERIPVFVRAGTVLPTWPVMQYTGAQKMEALILHVYAGDGDSWLYEDDGQSLDYQNGVHRVTEFECRGSSEPRLSVVRRSQGAFKPSYSRLEWNIHGLTFCPRHVLVDAAQVEGLSLDEDARVLRFASGVSGAIEVA